MLRIRSSRHVAIATCVVAVAIAAVVAAASVRAQASRPPAPGPAKVVVLAMDGLDPGLLARYLGEQRLPGFARLVRDGGRIGLESKGPSTTEVVWSELVTGVDAGLHGVLDSARFDRAKRRLRLPDGPAVVDEEGWLDRVRRWLGQPQQGRGPTRDVDVFWKALEQAGVHATILGAPTNDPLSGWGHELASGSLDALGASARFSFYTSDPEAKTGPVRGGTFYPVKVAGQSVRARLEATLRDDVRAAVSDFTLYFDPENPVAEIELGAEHALLNVGEWSPWLSVEIPPGIGPSRAMVRFHLRSTRPYVELYASPLESDPRVSSASLASPPDYASVLARASGPFSTRGSPEDLAALEAGALTARELWTQSDIALADRRRVLRAALESFVADPGRAFLLCHFSSLEQRSRALLRYLDPSHPDARTDATLARTLLDEYRAMDDVVAEVNALLPAGATLVVLSTHGSTPLRRQVHLNAWLEQNGYLSLAESGQTDDASSGLDGIDFSRTRAFALGAHSIYLETPDDLPASEREARRSALADQIATKLAAWRDVETGQAVVTAVLLAGEGTGSRAAEAPDLRIGYAPGYCASERTRAGFSALRALEDAPEWWSDAQCGDTLGVLAANRRLSVSVASPRDVTAGLLDVLGVTAPAHMSGHSPFAPGSSSSVGK